MLEQQQTELDERLVQKMFKVLRDSDVSISAKVLYSVLCSDSEKDTTDDTTFINVYTQDQIRELTGISSKATIKKALNELEEKNLVGVMRKNLYNAYLIY